MTWEKDCVETKGAPEEKEEEGGGWDLHQLSVYFQSPFRLSKTSSGLHSSDTTVSHFPAPWKGPFDLINIQLRSRSEKVHYAAAEMKLARCQDGGREKWEGGGVEERGKEIWR